MWSDTKEAIQKKVGDVHTRIMKKNYASVPNWWFHIILVAMLALSLLTCEGFGRQLQLPWWGVLLACAMAMFFTLPIAVITATTNQVPKSCPSHKIPIIVLQEYASMRIHKTYIQL